MLEVEVEPNPLTRLTAILTPMRMEQLQANAVRARAAFGDRVVWHINATAHGGGVAEMLQNLLAYGKGAQIANRCLVLDGDPEFFAITKRLHNRLHGTPGIAAPCRRLSMRTTRRSWRAISRSCSPACRRETSCCSTTHIPPAWSKV